VSSTTLAVSHVLAALAAAVRGSPVASTSAVCGARGQVVDRADFGHPLTVTLLAFGQLVASLVEDAAAAARPARPAALPALFQRPVLDRGGALPVQVTQQPLEPLPARHEPGGLRVRVVQHDSLRFGLPTVVAQEDRLGG